MEHAHPLPTHTTLVRLPSTSEPRRHSPAHNAKTKNTPPTHRDSIFNTVQYITDLGVYFRHPCTVKMSLANTA